VSVGQALKDGLACRVVLSKMLDDIYRLRPRMLIAHNTQFDRNVLLSELATNSMWDERSAIESIPSFCTMKKSTQYCALPRKKWPKLEELYWVVFNKQFANAHNSANDVEATRKCYFELVKRGVFESPWR